MCKFRNNLLCIVFFITFSSIGCQSKVKVKDNSSSKSNSTSYTDEKISKPVINVYLENSGSMDGYVKEVTDFKHAVYSYLSDIKISGLTDNINLFYINSQIIPHKNDIADFITKLNPTTFKQRGGNRSTTDIADVLKAILKETTEETVSIMVSDCVFSPGKGKNAKHYMINQQIGIKVNIADHLEKNKMAVVVYQLSSQFNGIYYNIFDGHTTINDRRPFYIWIIGNPKFISQLLNKIPVTKFKGSGVENYYTILPTFEKIDYAILANPKYGSFQRDKKSPKTSIHQLKKETKGQNAGKFMFTVGLNLSDFETVLGNDYLMDPNNYVRLINKQDSQDFQIKIFPNTDANSNYTHNIQLICQRIPVGNLEIALKNKIPQWVYEKNDDEGVNILVPGAMEKTFGIKYLIEGIYEAYENSGYTFYTSFDINLKK